MRVDSASATYYVCNGTSPAPRPGAVSVGALDFQPTVSGSANVVRVFDAFGSDTVNTRIGASIRPEDRAVPTSFSCWFTSTGIAFSTGKVKATLWSISNTRGSHPMASVEMSAMFTYSSPTQQSTTTFSFPSGLSAFNTVAGADVFRYLVEIEFVQEAWPDLKVHGCTVQYTTAP